MKTVNYKTPIIENKAIQYKTRLLEVNQAFKTSINWSLLKVMEFL